MRTITPQKARLIVATGCCIKRRFERRKNRPSEKIFRRPFICLRRNVGCLMFGGVGIARADFGTHDAFAFAVEQLEVTALDAVALHLRQGFSQLPFD